MQRISNLLAMVGAIGLWLGLMHAWPLAGHGSIALALLGTPPALIARVKLAEMRDQGDVVPIEDRLALFLGLSLFTVPLQLYVLSQFIFYRDGWELGPVSLLVHRWWLMLSS